MKVKIPHSHIIDGHQVKAGSQYTVDSKLKVAVDPIGRRISKETYDKHFKPEPKPKAKAETKTEKED